MHCVERGGGGCELALTVTLSSRKLKLKVTNSGKAFADTQTGPFANVQPCYSVLVPLPPDEKEGIQRPGERVIQEHL